MEEPREDTTDNQCINIAMARAAWEHGEPIPLLDYGAWRQLVVLAFTTRAQAAWEEHALASALARGQWLRGNPFAPRDGLYPYLRPDDLRMLPPVQWLVAGLLPVNDLACLYGASGVGKSFVALDLALTIAQHHPVTYIAAEAIASYTTRVGAWESFHQRQAGEIGFIPNAIALSDSGTIGMLLATLADVRPRVIVVDTLAQCMAGLDENSAQDMGRAMAGADAIRVATGAAVLLVHHTGKAGIEERGSSALRGACAVMASVQLDGDAIVVETSKNRHAAGRSLRRLALLPHNASAVVVPRSTITSDRAQLNDGHQRILSTLTLEVFRDTLVSASELVRQTNLSPATVSRRLSDLLKWHYVERDKGGIRITDDGREAESGAQPTTRTTREGLNWEVRS
jgi:DNA-binding transcriptional ArsR family regulator